MNFKKLTEHSLELIPKKPAKHLIEDGLKTFPMYLGKKHSIREVVNSDGTVNIKNAKKIMEDVASYFGGKKMQNRAENPVWHKTDPNTWLHTKQVAQNAWQIPVPEGYTKQDLMVAALGHDFGKMLSGDGHAEVSYNLIKLIFPDASPQQLDAIRRHMDPMEEISEALQVATKKADIGEFKQGGLVPKAEGGRKLLTKVFNDTFKGKSLKELSPQEWDTAYNYVLLKYGNKESNLLQRIRDYHFYTAAPDTVVRDASGKPLQVFHGSISPNIREFKLDTPNNASLTGTLDKRIYFSDSKGIAALYAVDPEYKLALTIDHLADAVGLDREGLKIIASSLKMPVKDVKKIVEDYEIGMNFVMRKTNQEDFIYPAYLNIRNHADVDLNGDIIARLSKEARTEINSKPGAIIRNVDETVDNQYGMRTRPTTDYLVQYPQQIKRSAAITYDTNGNIIPISQRDNFYNPDINYKVGGKLIPKAAEGNKLFNPILEWLSSRAKKYKINPISSEEFLARESNNINAIDIYRKRLNNGGTKIVQKRGTLRYAPKDIKVKRKSRDIKLMVDTLEVAEHSIPNGLRTLDAMLDLDSIRFHHHHFGYSLNKTKKL